MSETEGTTTEQSIESLPEWARESLTKANNEAAAARVAKREAVDYGFDAAVKKAVAVPAQ